jgi:hypothetical protein
MEIDDYKKRNCFRTPEGYFDNINSRIKEATCKYVVALPKKRGLKQRIVGIMSYAAMIAIVAVVATSIIFRHTSNSNPAIAFEELNDSEFIDNMLTNYPIDEYTFYCYFTGSE